MDDRGGRPELLREIRVQALDPLPSSSADMVLSPQEMSQTPRNSITERNCEVTTAGKVTSGMFERFLIMKRHSATKNQQFHLLEYDIVSSFEKASTWSRSGRGFNSH
jgi:hypothetical protein